MIGISHASPADTHVDNTRTPPAYCPPHRLKFAECWGKYVMTDAAPPEILQLLDELLDTIAFLTRREFDDFDAEGAKLRVVELLCKFEVSVPAIEHAIVFHELVHLVADIARWGSGLTAPVHINTPSLSHAMRRHMQTLTRARAFVHTPFAVIWMFSFERSVFCYFRSTSQH
jgi:hypothetical protein